MHGARHAIKALPSAAAPLRAANHSPARSGRGQSRMTEARAKPALEFKGRMTTLTTLRLLDSSVEVLARELDKRLREAPALFRRLPIVVDIAEAADTDLYLDLPGFVELLRTRELLPIGIRGGDQRWTEAADA